MKRPVVNRLCSAVLLALLVMAGRGAVQAAPDAESYVSRIADRVVTAAHREPVAEFRTIFQEHADIAAISKVAAGRYGRVMSPVERDQVKRFVSASIGQAFASYSGWLRGERVEVTGSRDKGNSTVVVFSKLVGGSVDEIKWKLARSDDGFQVLDVNIGGLWLSMQMRSMLSARLKRARGDVTAALSD
ncbi:MAG: ABC transporter substrate-binding protein [Hyphomicrobiales bacterium]